MRSISQRDLEQQREFREFATAEAERQRLDADHAEWEKYRQIVEDEQRGLSPAYRIEPLDFITWRSYAPEDQPNAELRGVLATNKALVQRTAEHTATEVRNGKDPDAYIDPATAGRSMTLEAAQAYNGGQGKLFREQNPWWYGSEANKTALLDYLERNGIQIASAETLLKAAERLRVHGLLEERPEPQPEPTPQPEPETVAEPVDDGSMVGIDPVTGLERRYTSREIGRMTSYEFKRAFDLNLEKRLQAWDEMFIGSRY